MESSNDSSSPSVPRLGVAVSSIESFLELLGGPDELETFTTKEAISQYILPAVASKNHSKRYETGAALIDHRCSPATICSTFHLCL